MEIPDRVDNRSCHGSIGRESTSEHVAPHGNVPTFRTDLIRKGDTGCSAVGARPYANDIELPREGVLSTICLLAKERGPHAQSRVPCELQTASTLVRDR